MHAPEKTVRAICCATTEKTIVIIESLNVNYGNATRPVSEHVRVCVRVCVRQTDARCVRRASMPPKTKKKTHVHFSPHAHRAYEDLRSGVAVVDKSINAHAHTHTMDRQIAAINNRHSRAPGSDAAFGAPVVRHMHSTAFDWRAS